MKKVKLFEQFIAEKREKVGEYNTVKKVVAELGRRPSEQDLASFINDNYYDVTEVERGEDDPRANDKIADLVAFYKFDIDDWEIAWSDAQNESVVTEAKDNLYLQLHKKYAEFIKGLKAGKIKKLTDLVSVQRWSMEDREDYFDMDSKKKKELSAEYNEERKLFKKYVAGDESVMLPKGTEALAESVVNEDSKDRMIKQIERALKDGTSIFKLPMATQKYYNKNKGDFESVVTESKIKVTKRDIKDIEDSGNIDIAYKKAIALLMSLVESVVTESKIKVTKRDIKDIEDSGNIDIAYKKAIALLMSLVESTVTENSVTFTLDDGDLDDKFLSDKSLSRNLDYKEDGRDTYYVLPKRDFDRLQDWADSSGYDTDEVIEVIDESVVTEAVSRATKIYQIATPAPKAMLVEELEDLFGDDYRNIVTEFDDDERYESVLVFNLTPRDIKRIQEEIADVLIWEYSIKKGKEISESAMIEALSKSDRKAIAYTMAEQDPEKVKELQNAIGQDFSDNYSSTSRSILVDVKKKGGKWVAITKETESEYNNKKPKRGEREATIGITWNAMFF